MYWLEIDWNNFEGLYQVLTSGEIILLVIGSFSLFIALALIYAWRKAAKGDLTQQAEQRENNRAIAGEDGVDLEGRPSNCESGEQTLITPLPKLAFYSLCNLEMQSHSCVLFL